MLRNFFAGAIIFALAVPHGIAQPEVEHSALVITAVFDGPLLGSQPKGIELYVSRDVSDLRAYGIQLVNNPEEAAKPLGPQYLFPVGSSATAGQYIHVAQNSTDFRDYFGVDPDYLTPAVTNNGDDAVVLFFNGDVVDVLGEFAQTGGGTGQDWYYESGFVHRIDGTGPSGSRFQPDQFVYSGVGALDGCTTTNEACPSTIPLNTYSTSALPVQYTSFSIAALPGGAKLTWSTAAEVNNDYFAIEVSLDGESYTEAGRVDGRGTNPYATDYTYTYTGLASGPHYFRLRQTDFDGQATYSRVVTARIEEQLHKLSIANVNATGMLTITTARAGQLLIISATGTTIARHDIPSAGTHDLSIDGLSPGVYAVTNGLETHRFLKH